MLAFLFAAALASAPETQVVDWRAAAERDLNAVHDNLKSSSPALYVRRDSATFRQWLDTGFEAAKRDLPRVYDARSYHYLLRGYTGGFRDSHIAAGLTQQLRPKVMAIAWPGLIVEESNVRVQLAKLRRTLGCGAVAGLAGAPSAVR